VAGLEVEARQVEICQDVVGVPGRRSDRGSGRAVHASAVGRVVNRQRKAGPGGPIVRVYPIAGQVGLDERPGDAPVKPGLVAIGIELGCPAVIAGLQVHQVFFIITRTGVGIVHRPGPASTGGSVARVAAVGGVHACLYFQGRVTHAGNGIGGQVNSGNGQVGGRHRAGSGAVGDFEQVAGLKVETFQVELRQVFIGVPGCWPHGGSGRLVHPCAVGRVINRQCKAGPYRPIEPIDPISRRAGLDVRVRNAPAGHGVIPVGVPLVCLAGSAGDDIEQVLLIWVFANH